MTLLLVRGCRSLPDSFRHSTAKLDRVRLLTITEVCNALVCNRCSHGRYVHHDHSCWLHPSKCRGVCPWCISGRLCRPAWGCRHAPSPLPVRLLVARRLQARGSRCGRKRLGVSAQPVMPCQAVPRGWFAISLANSSPANSVYGTREEPTRRESLRQLLTNSGRAIHVHECLHRGDANQWRWPLHPRHGHDLDDFYPCAGHLQMRMVFAEYLCGRIMRFGLHNRRASDLIFCI
jgi:hypothetical protein